VSQSISSPLRTLDHEIAGLHLLRQSLTGPLGGRLAEAVTLILRKRGRIHVTGIGKSGHIARKIAATLTSTGTPAHFLHPTEAAHGDLGDLRPEDTLLALSWSGDTPELVPLTDFARSTAIPILAITAHPRSLLALSATILLELPHSPEACPDNLAPTTSTTMQLALGDAFPATTLWPSARSTPAASSVPASPPPQSSCTPATASPSSPPAHSSPPPSSR
jgi:arabinose-5-phosphate isomerase